jgi:tetratricopeptide (TPR) repeat protein
MTTMNNLANVLMEEKRHEEAEKMYREVLQVYRRDQGPDAVNTIYSLHNLGSVCARLGRLDEAETLLRQAHEGASRVMGPRSPDALESLVGLAGVAALRGRRAQALEMIREAVEAGYRDPVGSMAKEPDFESLRGDPEFDRLVLAARAVPGSEASADP